MNERNPGGTFAKGWAGGPGRPRRAVEAHYLLAISEACPPERWKEIVQRAVEDAKGGDPKAREWLAGYLVGRPSDVMSLESLAVRERQGRTVDDDIDDKAARMSLLAERIARSL